MTFKEKHEALMDDLFKLGVKHKVNILLFYAADEEKRFWDEEHYFDDLNKKGRKDFKRLFEKEDVCQKKKW